MNNKETKQKNLLTKEEKQYVFGMKLKLAFIAFVIFNMGAGIVYMLIDQDQWNLDKWEKAGFTALVVWMGILAFFRVKNRLDEAKKEREEREE